MTETPASPAPSPPPLGTPPEFSSRLYWERRYASGGNSGAGSFGRLAGYKAEFLNGFVREHAIAETIEFGCGDGNQLGLLDFPAYVGVDVSDTALARCRLLYADRPGWSFFNATDRASYAGRAYQLTLSLDVIFHLVEDAVFESYMAGLFALSSRFVIVYSSDWDELLLAPHVRHRWFSGWVARNRPDWSLTQRRKTPFPEDPARPAETTFAEFHVFERREPAAPSPAP